MQILEFFWLVYLAGFEPGANWFLVTWTSLLTAMPFLAAVLIWLQWHDRRRLHR